VNRVRVVIADRSTAVRAVLKRILARSSALEVVGEAADGRQLVDCVQRQRPDVIVTEFHLPDPDGYTPHGQIMEQCPTPIVVLTPRPDAGGSHVPYWAASSGVVEVLQKPQVPDGWNELAPALNALLQQVGVQSPTIANELQPPTDLPSSWELEYIAIGGSTGGPGAIVRLLKEFGTEFEAGVAVVQHIADGFEHAFALWLKEELGADVRVAEQGDRLGHGTIRIAPVGSHLLIDRRGRVRLDASTPPRRGHRPSVDLLFRSFLSVGAERVAAVLLSGMGDDGVEGMRALRDAGSLTLAQNEASSAVYGMPKLALESRAAELALTPTQIGRLLARTMTGGSG
jgi:two-component system chemotaxis response regulator CheB